jgi:hypothetical protein
VPVAEVVSDPAWWSNLSSTLHSIPEGVEAQAVLFGLALTIFYYSTILFLLGGALVYYMYFWLDSDDKHCAVEIQNADLVDEDEYICTPNKRLTIKWTAQGASWIGIYREKEKRYLPAHVHAENWSYCKGATASFTWSYCKLHFQPKEAGQDYKVVFFKSAGDEVLDIPPMRIKVVSPKYLELKKQQLSQNDDYTRLRLQRLQPVTATVQASAREAAELAREAAKKEREAKELQERLKRDLEEEQQQMGQNKGEACLIM